MDLSSSTCNNRAFCTSLPIPLVSLGDNSLRNYHYTWCNIPEEHRYHLHHGRSLKSCTLQLPSYIELYNAKSPLPVLFLNLTLLMFLKVSLILCLSPITMHACLFSHEACNSTHFFTLNIDKLAEALHF